MFSFRRTPAPATQPRREAASPEALREYDSFGAWCSVIENEEEMPPKFRPFWEAVGGSSLLIKVPVDVDRRDAEPGQDLYREVLALQADKLVVLTLIGGAVVYRAFAFTEIQAVRQTVSLLRCELQLFTRTGSPFTLAYHSLSQALMDRLVDALAAQLADEFTAPVLGTAPVVEDLFLRNLKNDVTRRYPGAQIVYCEEPAADGQGILAFDSGRHVIFVNLGQDVASAQEGVFSYRLTFVPRSRWKGFTVATGEVTLTLEGQPLGYRVQGDSTVLASALVQIPAI